MANIFSNFGNKLGNAFTNLGQGGNLFNADPTQIAALSNEDKKRFKQQGLQRLADSFMVAGAIGSGDAQRIALAQNQIRQRKVEEKNAEQERQMQEAFGNNPELLNIYNTFGKGAAFQESQRLRNAEINAAQQQKQKEGLIKAGFSDREINLFFDAGMKADDILALRDQGSNKKTIEELNTEVLDSKENVSDGLKNLDAAFGVVDTVKGAAAKYLGPVSPIQIAPVTTSANAARNTLNERVREKFLSEYSGRPSVYLNVRIDALLPQGSYSTELEAKQKYQEVRRVLKEGLAEMESKIQSNVYKEDELIEVQEQYKDIQSVVKDLDVGINALSKNSSETLSNETSSGSYDSFYTGG
jgi:hypothetical protein